MEDRQHELNVTYGTFWKVKQKGCSVEGLRALTARKPVHAGGVVLRKRWRSRRPIAKHAPHAFLGESGIPYVAAHLGSRPAMGAQSIQDLLSCKRIRRLDMPEVVFLLSAGERFAEGAGGDVADPVGYAGPFQHFGCQCFHGTCREIHRVPNATSLKASILAHQTSAEDAGRAAQAAGVKTLVLSHLIPPDDPEVTEQMWIDAAHTHFRGPVIVGKDLLEV